MRDRPIKDRCPGRTWMFIDGHWTPMYFDGKIWHILRDWDGELPNAK